MYNGDGDNAGNHSRVALPLGLQEGNLPAAADAMTRLFENALWNGLEEGVCEKGGSVFEACRARRFERSRARFDGSFHTKRWRFD